MRTSILAALTFSLAPGLWPATAQDAGPRVFGSANAYFFVYSVSCAPAFYNDVAFPGAPPSAIEVTLDWDLFRTRYGSDCGSFYDAEIMHRQMATVIYLDPLFAEGEGGLSALEARLLGQRFWISMAARSNRCPHGDFADADIDNRALAAIGKKANLSDVILVARGMIDTFEDMQGIGFNEFRSMAERCKLIHQSALDLVDKLVDGGLLVPNETGI